jgi:V8-like Glu-specific endopeptidase
LITLAAGAFAAPAQPVPAATPWWDAWRTTAPNWPNLSGQVSPTDDLGHLAPLVPTPPSRHVALDIDSGLITRGVADTDGLARRWQVRLEAPGSRWVRVVFAGADLPGDPHAETGARIVIRSVEDGQEQAFTSETIGHWSGVSAEFNGGAVDVELWVDPATGPARVRIAGLHADAPGALAPTGPRFALRDLCGPDRRELSFDNRSARTSGGCTAWLIDDLNNHFLTAGHCGVSGTSVMSFNVPLSTASGTRVAANVRDQYPADAPSIQSLNSGVGADWRYFGVLPNSTTGLTPVQAYAVFHRLASAMPPADARTIRITGYGTTSAPVSPTWNGVQKTHAGPLASVSGNRVRYNVDTTGGNSGSPILDELTGLAIGVHTHAGCSSGGNQGTAITRADLQAALAAPLGVSASGKGVAGGPVFALGDANNNFGTVRTLPEGFAKIATVGSRWQGLTHHPQTDHWLGIDATRTLWWIDDLGQVSALGIVSGTTQTLTGLAYDPAGGAGAGRLYAIATGTGQLLRIDLNTLVATPIGAASGAGVRALEFDPSTGVLYGLENTGSGATAAVRLVVINTSTGARTVVGEVGVGLGVSADLAASDDGTLRTINAATGELLTIDPATGSGTVLGPTGGRFGASFGLASRRSLPGACCVNQACVIVFAAECPGRFAGPGTVCDPPATTNPIACCRANFNLSGGVSIDDLFIFLNAWFRADPRTDATDSGNVSIDDIFVFLNLWFTGCA